MILKDNLRSTNIAHGHWNIQSHDLGFCIGISEEQHHFPSDDETPDVTEEARTNEEEEEMDNVPPSESSP